MKQRGAVQNGSAGCAIFHEFNRILRDAKGLVGVAGQVLIGHDANPNVEGCSTIDPRQPDHPRSRAPFGEHELV